MRRTTTTLAVIAVTFMLGAMFACGGGGGSESVSYTGETMAAVIDTTDAVDLARDAVLDTMEGDSQIDTGMFPLTLSESDALAKLLDPDVAAGILINALTGEPAASPLGVSAEPLAYRCFSGSDGGLVDGTISGRICGDYDEVLDEFTTIDFLQGTFSNYSDDGVEYFNGTMIFDMRSGDLRLTFRDLSFEDDVDELFLDGTASFIETASGTSINFNIFILINGEGVWFNELVLVEEDFITHIANSIDGRIYDFVDGYIDIETIEVLVTQDGDLFPSSGIIKLTGADGASIRLEVVDETGFMIYVDVDGDSIDDWQTSSPQPWIIG